MSSAEAHPGETELLALKRIDETSTKLQKQGSYLEALECMERGLVLRQHFFGPDSDQVRSACKVVGEMCNLLAVTYLEQDDAASSDLARELLEKAEILTERDARGRAVTCNNFACYHRRKGQLRSALRYLQRALRIESRMTGEDGAPRADVDAADTHLNACAVLSQLGRHQLALDHAQSALILLQEEMFKGLAAAESAAAASSEGAKDDGDSAGTTIPVKLDRIAVLSIAYHNIGVEQEFLKRFEGSLQSYQKGMEIAERYLGREHSVTRTLKNSFLVAQRAIEAKSEQGRTR